MPEGLEKLERLCNVKFERKIFTRTPLGKRGKVFGAQSQSCDLLVDDRADICREALTKGSLVNLSLRYLFFFGFVKPFFPNA